MQGTKLYIKHVSRNKESNMEQLQIFPEIQIVRTPRVVKAICECAGSVANFLAFIPDLGITHGDHFNRTDVRDEANQVVN